MSDRFCCVCNKALSPHATPLGRRYFCNVHRAMALKSLQFDWTRSGMIEIGLVGLFVSLVGWLGGDGASGALPTSMEVGLLLAVVPTLIWMAYIYRLDRVEPEPWSMVFGVFFAAGLLWHSIGKPVMQDVFQISSWVHHSTVSETVAAVFLVGTLQQLCTYLAVRYTVYLTGEFDDPLDGIVYATAASLGVATLTNIDFVMAGSGVLPLEGATAIATSALINVAAAAVLGYGLGRARFSNAGVQRWIGGAFALSVVTHGGLSRLASIMGIEGRELSPMLTLSVTLVAAVVILLLIDRLMVRLMFESLATPTPQPRAGATA